MRSKMGLLFSNEQTVRNPTKESDTLPYIYAPAGAHTPSNVCWKCIVSAEKRC